MHFQAGRGHGSANLKVSNNPVLEKSDSVACTTSGDRVLFREISVEATDD